MRILKPLIGFAVFGLACMVFFGLLIGGLWLVYSGRVWVGMTALAAFALWIVLFYRFEDADPRNLT